MCKKLIILSLFLQIVGISAFGLGLFDQKKEKQRLQMQRDMFSYELVNLKDLIENKTEGNFVAFEENRKQQLDKYKARIEIRELIFSVSIVSVGVGTIFSALAVLRSMRKPQTASPAFMLNQ